jgi:hypothetical protein
MRLFADIRPTEHYLEYHADVPWETIYRIVLSTKNPRRKGDKYEIEAEGVYLLIELREGIAWVINAKKSGY